jgi:UDP-glucose 4-epimerase
MRVAVVGATGNLGSALVEALVDDSEIESITGIARRRPDLQLRKVRWQPADISRDRLVEVFSGADAVVHLAWLIQPSRAEGTLEAVNVQGSRRVFEAVAEARVPTLVYASSVGAYSPGPKDQPVDEHWPTEGVPSSFYSRHKAAVERSLDRFEADHPAVRVVRMRPALIFGRQAATGIRRLFMGPLFPGTLLRDELIPLVPQHERLIFQAVHRDDVAEAFRLAIHGQVRGPFNVAAEPVIDPDALAELFRARRVRISPRVLRAAASVSWRLRLQPTPPGWLDLGLAVPVMATGRAREELGWSARRSSLEALRDLIEGLRTGAGYPTPPLDPRTSGPLRSRELRTGVGATLDDGGQPDYAAERTGRT